MLNFQRYKSLSPPSTPSKYNLGSGLLFATPTKSPTTSPSKGTLEKSSTSQSNYGFGYLAFPTGYAGANNTTSSSTPSGRSLPAPDDFNKPILSPSVPHDSASPERAARISKETAEARRGEEEWVRNGGILRDANGNRDFKRTEELREELRLREVEKGLVERWAKYEARWKELMRKVNLASNDGPITFDDIPWPVSLHEDKEKKTGAKGKQKERKITIEDITTENIEEFILGSLRVRGSTVSRKERIRASLLRWHPDKLTGLLAKVSEDDREMVEDGIGIVVRVLHDINTK
ncbi:hypothetical protein V5O48_002274 [Marasmius crinis-equi]|uniref:Uncharacterized protein n=1 Tax=Marasmius crinis-equi TaxID=585013 RepID=A0ABR3FW50_9AGAR